MISVLQNFMKEKSLLDNYEKQNKTKQNKQNNRDFVLAIINRSVEILKYKQFKNAFKTVVGRSGAKINGFLCFGHFLSASTPYFDDFFDDLQLIGKQSKTASNL